MTGGFEAKTDYATGARPQAVALADVNGDGWLDLVTANNAASSASILLGLATGGFGAKTDYATGPSSVGVALGDVSGDGRPDVAIANFHANTASVLLNTTPFPAPTLTTPSPGSGGGGASVTLTGTSLSSTQAVAFNGTAARFTVNSSTQLTATVPTGATSGPILVTTPGGTASAPTFVVGPLATADALEPVAVAVFPNPAHGSVTLGFSPPFRKTGVTVTVLNTLGQQVWQQRFAPASVEVLDLRGVVPGVYALHLETSHATVLKRLVVQ